MINEKHNVKIKLENTTKQIMVTSFEGLGPTMVEKVPEAASLRFKIFINTSNGGQKEVLNQSEFDKTMSNDDMQGKFVVV